MGRIDKEEHRVFYSGSSIRKLEDGKLKASEYITETVTTWKGRNVK